MQDALFRGKVITKTFLITEMSPEPSQTGYRVPDDPGNKILAKPQPLALSLVGWLEAEPLVSGSLGSNFDSATDLQCDLDLHASVGENSSTSL